MKKKPNSDKSWPFEGMKAHAKLRLMLRQEFSPLTDVRIVNSLGIMPASVVAVRRGKCVVVFGMN